jgi:hypothetical protein
VKCIIGQHESLLLPNLTCKVPSVFIAADRNCTEEQVFIQVLNETINITNNFIRCPSRLEVLDTKPRVLFYQGADFNSTLTFELNHNLAETASYFCLVGYQFREREAAAHPYDREKGSCTIRVSAELGLLTTLALGIVEDDSLLAEVDESKLPIIVFELPQVSPVGPITPLIPYAQENTVGLQLRLDSDLKDALGSIRGLSILAKAASDRRVVTEYHFSLESVLETPGQVFELQELRIFERHLTSFEIELHLDIRSTDSVEGEYLPLGELTIPLLPWLPRIETEGPLVAVRDASNKIRLDVTFAEEIADATFELISARLSGLDSPAESIEKPSSKTLQLGFNAEGTVPRESQELSLDFEYKTYDSEPIRAPFEGLQVYIIGQMTPSSVELVPRVNASLVYDVTVKLGSAPQLQSIETIIRGRISLRLFKEGRLVPSSHEDGLSNDS